MKPFQKYFFLFPLVLFSLSNCYCQVQDYASNIKTSISSDGKSMYIKYDIVATDGAAFFEIKFMPTIDGKEIKVNPGSLSGAFEKQDLGTGKVIKWEFRKDFEGEIANVKIDVYAYRQDEPESVLRIISMSNNGYAPCEVKFTCNSAYAREFEWDFGDLASGVRNHSFLKEPTHIYEKEGPYNIKLTARNNEIPMENSYYRSVEIKEPVKITADFSFKVVGTKAPWEVSFNTQSANADIFLWNFGDSTLNESENSSDLENPVHTFKNPGKYDVTLTALNSKTGFSVKVTHNLIFKAEEIPAVTIPSPVISARSSKPNVLKPALIAASAASLAISGLTYVKANSSYKKYQDAKEDAADWRKKTLSNSKISPVAFGVSVACAAGGFFLVKKPVAKNQASLRTVPLPKGGGFALTYNF